VKNEVFVKSVKGETVLKVYTMGGMLYKTFRTSSDTSFTMPAGIWLVTLQNPNGMKSVKIITH
jgi:exo-poly-alpha-galacturonosidase